MTGPDDIGPADLTTLLRRGGHEDAQVTHARLILTKKLAYSTVARFEVEYLRPTDLPSAFFVKFIDRSAIEADQHQTGAKEIEFYNSIAPAVSCPPLVHCYFAGTVEVTGVSVIVLEDLFESHSQPKQNTVPSLEETVMAIEALARSHAAWWDRPELSKGLGAPFENEIFKNFISNLESSVGRFVAEFPGVASQQKEALALMTRNAETIWSRILRGDGRTITHGDCHWWNFLFPKKPKADSVRVIDWHLWHTDLGARDLAFLLALGGFAEPRPEIEEMLLRKYLETLRSNGVFNYDWDLLREDYRWSAIRNLNIPVIFWTQGKHDSTVQTALRRAYEAFERLNCRELIA